MKTPFKISSVIALALTFAVAPVKAQSVYAVSADAASLVSYVSTNATTVITNVTRDPFRLSALPGGQSYLGYTFSSVCGTNATQTNRITVTCATAALDSSTGPWRTNIAILADNTGGTNTAVFSGETNLGSNVRFIKIVGVTVNGTNTAASAGTTTTFRFHQHR